MTVTVASETVIPTGTWVIDPSHSSLEFGVRHLGLVTVKGRAPGLTGTITGGDSPAIQGTVTTDGITTFDEQRDAHLASPEFFDAERHPELSFVSTSLSEQSGELVVEGELTIKGITQPVMLRGGAVGPSTDPWGNARIGVTLSGTIDRTAFGLRWNAPLPGGGFLLADEVSLAASFSAVKES